VRLILITAFLWACSTGATAEGIKSLEERGEKIFDHLMPVNSAPMIEDFRKVCFENASDLNKAALVMGGFRLRYRQLEENPNDKKLRKDWRSTNADVHLAKEETIGNPSDLYSYYPQKCIFSFLSSKAGMKSFPKKIEAQFSLGSAKLVTSGKWRQFTWFVSEDKNGTHFLQLSMEPIRSHDVRITLSSSFWSALERDRLKRREP
jgi:hypothetical protein